MRGAALLFAVSAAATAVYVGISARVRHYPSGHALETTAVAVTASWIADRENLVPPSITVPVAAMTSAISGLGRLVLDRHWTTDSIAGYLAGIALGTACAGAYELARA